MKNLSTHLTESLEDNQLIYHLSYDINNAGDEYSTLKEQLINTITRTNPDKDEEICESTRIILYKDKNVDLFSLLEKANLSSKINYCISVVSKTATNKFEIDDKEGKLKSKIKDTFKN